MEDYDMKRNRTRYELSSFERISQICIANNPKYFLLKQKDQLEALPPPIQSELRDFVFDYHGNTTPDTLPLLLKLGVIHVKIDLNEWRDTYKTSTWTREDAIDAFSLIISAGSQVVGLWLKFAEVSDHPCCLTEQQIYEWLQKMTELRCLEFPNWYLFEDTALQYLPPKLESLRITLDIHHISSHGYRSLLTRFQDLVHIQAPNVLRDLSPEHLLLALENLPNLEVLEHHRLETAVFEYARKHGSSKPLNLTLIEIRTGFTAPFILSVLPKLQEISLWCKIPLSYCPTLRFISKLRTCDTDDVLELWGKNLTLLEVKEPNRVAHRLSITKVATLSPNLQYLTLSNIILNDTTYNNFTLTPGKHFNQLRELDVKYCLCPAQCMVTLLTSPNLTNVKFCYNNFMDQYIDVALIYACFPSLRYVEFMLCGNAEELFKLMCVAPRLRKVKVDVK